MGFFLLKTFCRAPEEDRFINKTRFPEKMVIVSEKAVKRALEEILPCVQRITKWNLEKDFKFGIDRIEIVQKSPLLGWKRSYLLAQNPIAVVKGEISFGLQGRESG